MPIPVILDCDTGSDDAVAIMCAALHPELQLLGVTTVWGNHDVEYTTDNTLRALDVAGRDDVPVLRGLNAPFRPRTSPLPSGRDGLPSSVALPTTSRRAHPTPAVEWLVETLRAATDLVTLVPTGPLTNVAAAFAAHPRITESVEQVIALAGTHAQTGVLPLVERNVWCDPEAAAYVVGLGLRRLTLIGMDATFSAPLDTADVQLLRKIGAPGATAAADLLEERIAWYARDESMAAIGAAPLHDPLAVAAVVLPDVVDTVPAGVEVDLGSGTYGRTVYDFETDRPTVSVAMAADRQRFRSWLVAALSARPRRVGPRVAR